MFIRQTFHQVTDSPSDARHAAAVLRLLLAQDGSATRLCETVAATQVTVHLVRQEEIDEVPEEVRSCLPGDSFIERTTTLVAHGQVMMDNLAYIAVAGASDELRGGLEAGGIPIGHMLQRMWTRRMFLATPSPLHDRLWASVGTPDASASRLYAVETPSGPLMMIAETFRRGMLMAPPMSID